MEDAGAAAVVLYSLFEEQLRQDRLELNQNLQQGTESFAEALTYFPEPDEFRLGPEEYLKHIAAAKKATRIPIIASLNGSSDGRLDGLRQANPAGRRRRAGAEHLLHPHRPEPDRHGSGNDVSRHSEGGEIRRDHSGRGEIEPVLQQLRQHGQAAGRRRARTAWCCSTVSTSRTSSWNTLEVKPNILLSTPMAMRAAAALDCPACTDG